MNTAQRVIRTVGALLLGLAVAGAPVLTYAQPGFGGGGHFGGGHFGGGGGHFSGGHSMGHMSAPHFGGGGHFAGGFGGTHIAGPHFAGGGLPHSPVHGATHFSRPGLAAGAGWHGGTGWQGGAGWHGGGAAGNWHGWRGGWWGGAFWPHVWFGPGFAWFLPILPLGYATFWWGGVPYYYWNNIYYTWSPADNGYVVTDPPPVADGTVADNADGTADSAAQYSAPPAQYSGAGQSGSGADVYLYPRNGQSTEQTQNDRYECHSWAVNQTGFDPTRSSQQSSGSGADYRRAMIACLDARGYSAR